MRNKDDMRFGQWAYIYFKMTPDVETNNLFNVESISEGLCIMEFLKVNIPIERQLSDCEMLACWEIGDFNE